MRINLLKSSAVLLKPDGMLARVPGLIEFQPCTEAELGKIYCKQLNNQLLDKQRKGSSISHDFGLRFTTGLQNSSIHVFFRSRETLKEIKDLMNENGTHVQFQATVCLLEFGIERKNTADSNSRPCITSTVHTKEMTLEQKGDGFVCSDDTAKVTDMVGGRSLLNRRGEYYATVTVSMTTSKISMDPATLQQTQLNINQSILNDEVTSDVMIIPGNGNAVKCHRAFLVANSPVFAAMFHNGMEEAKSGQIQMPDRSEHVVRAFVAYLYFRDLTEPNRKLEIAFELLKMGHKYHIPDLEAVMTNLLKYKPLEWFDDIDVSMRIYLFARNATDADKLKHKALIVMKEKRSELQESSTFKNLFIKNSAIAMEFCEDLAGAGISVSIKGDKQRKIRQMSV